MSKKEITYLGVGALIALVFASRLRKLPLVNKIPEA